ncbi:MAG TPA: response regulator transcription factor [Acidobacteriota bacterium]|jgi:two-component system phosphate regulon response regulator PhoB
MPESILIIEDEQDIAELVSFHLSRAGYATHVYQRGLPALEGIQKKPPSLIVLDLMLPDLDGIEICKRLKSHQWTRDIPIVMLTARGAETDRVLGLELGADDYLPKPFSPRELVLRIQAILRRVAGNKRAGVPAVFGPLSIDVEAHRVSLHDKPLELTRTEFKLLDHLVQRRGKVARREDLLNTVWGYQYEGGTRTVDTHVQRLRQKLGQFGERIETVRGVGYRFRHAETEEL